MAKRNGLFTPRSRNDSTFTRSLNGIDVHSGCDFACYSPMNLHFPLRFNCCNLRRATSTIQFKLRPASSLVACLYDVKMRGTRQRITTTCNQHQCGCTYMSPTLQFLRNLHLYHRTPSYRANSLAQHRLDQPTTSLSCTVMPSPSQISLLEISHTHVYPTPRLLCNSRCAAPKQYLSPATTGAHYGFTQCETTT